MRTGVLSVLKRALGPKVWRFLKIAAGREIYAKIDRKVTMERFGAEYFWWDVATDYIDESSVVYSFGVGMNVTFDVALIKRFGSTVHAFDPTPLSIEWVKGQDLPKGFVMHEYGIADFDGDVTCDPSEGLRYGSDAHLERLSKASRLVTVPVKKLETIMQQLGHDHIDLLKMDVEGSEYSVIEDLVRSTVRPGQLLVEFHHRFENVGLHKTKAAVEALKGAGYSLVHISDTGEEYSFLKA